jgi:hypothetical protein
MDKEPETAGQLWPVAFYLAALVPPMDYTQILKMVEDPRKVVLNHLGLVL